MQRWSLVFGCVALVGACDGRPVTVVDGGDAAACTDECVTVGETRCSGTVIEGCAVGSSGCLAWRAGLDCSASGTTCDDSTEPAICGGAPGTCTDTMQNQDETDVDCGGTRCPACAIGEGCLLAADCDSRNCDTQSMTCVTPGTPTCTDRAQNQDESDIDCGGAICDGCGVGAMCAGNDDCRSASCVGGRCAAIAGTCTDSTENQDETDVDCGGATCDPCGIGQRCMLARDCSTNNCNGTTCVAAGATCTDSTQNGMETDIDCGGPTCDPCMDGQSCAAAGDCTSGFCNRNTCVAAGTCTDRMRNGSESDIDCGGSCSPCPNGRACTAPADCRSGSCDSGGSDLCVNPGGPTCTDMIRNRDETDVDCGGAFCARCLLGEECGDSTDCATGACDLRTTPHECIGTTPSFDADEDFETGDFSRFPYSHTSAAGAMNWVIETAAASCHAGSFCMRSNLTHPTGGTSAVELSLSVRESTNISFWVRTNLEMNEHYFRFYVDGVMAREITGVNGWTLVTVPVAATGAGGPNRVFRWEYTRSTYVSPDHPPYYEVWVDDIDMPAWNTEPTVPELVHPTNGQLTTDTTPTFRWRSFDADFDTITYEMHYDMTPAFTDPRSTGETNDTQFTPPAPLMNRAYYWRVRAKDDSNYRWSAWSPTYSVTVDSSYEYGSVWRQTLREQFQMNDLGGMVVDAETVRPSTTSFDRTVGPTAMSFNGGTSTVTLMATPPAPTGTNATLTVTGQGDFDSGGTSEYASVQVEGTSAGNFSPGSCSVFTTNYTITDVGRFVNDGMTTLSFVTSANVDAAGCGTPTANTWTARLQYTSVGTGVMTSVPIEFSTFEGRTLWEKVQVVGTGTIRITVLDLAGNPIPDAIIPGNTAGNTARTIHLWNLDPMVHPAIRLRAQLGAGAVLDEWRVVGNDVFEWTFSSPGDSEGWVAQDYMATPTATVAGGVLRVASTASGDDPRVLYTMPQPLDARRFTRLLVRVRTSNNYNNDDVTLFWSSNFGMIDTRRSFTESGIFLVTLQDIEFDLTAIPPAPNEPWRGNIESLRVDPVLRFLDERMMPTDGWFEIDRIAIY